MRIAESLRVVVVLAAICCHPVVTVSAPLDVYTDTVPSLLLVAESGSIGGKVGRAPRPAVRPAPTTRTPAVPTRTAPAGPTIAGKWRWSAQCEKSGRWTGSLILSGGAGAFAGTMTQDQSGDGGEVFDGRVSGTGVSFKRRFTSRFLGEQVQTWSGTLSGGAISGQIAYFAEGCSFAANR